MTLNIGLIGTGGIAENGHADALSLTPSARLWSVLSRDFNRAKEFSRKYNAAAPNPAHDLLDSFLADPELDAVIIATPDKLHFPQAIAAISAKKHILLEKPMATNTQDAQAILVACQNAKVTLALAYRLRWHPGHRKLVGSAHSGKFGELRHVRVLWSTLKPDATDWRASEELGRWWSLGAVGTHCLDLARWTLGPSAGEIKIIRSVVTQKVWQGPHDETAVLAIEFTSGATAEVCSSVLFASPSRFEIYGSNGFGICEDTFGRAAAGKIWTNEGAIKFETRNPFVDQLEDFALAIKEDHEPEVNGIEGARNVEILQSVVQNANKEAV